MSGISAIISVVDGKVAQLIRFTETLKAQLKYAESRNQELLVRLSEKDKQIAQLEEQIRNVQTNQVMAAPSNGKPVAVGSHDANLKINELVREINKCIALLNR